mmetsp:Transcript_21133/g.47608  ORF Transcript_21133/g.47608 Transcript_21133/m.47608 type:complete len:210 (+) Transcript_21133:279-908(+)
MRHRRPHTLASECGPSAARRPQLPPAPPPAPPRPPQPEAPIAGTPRAPRRAPPPPGRGGGWPARRRRGHSSGWRRGSWRRLTGGRKGRWTGLRLCSPGPNWRLPPALWVLPTMTSSSIPGGMFLSSSARPCTSPLEGCFSGLNSGPSVPVLGRPPRGVGPAGPGRGHGGCRLWIWSRGEYERSWEIQCACRWPSGLVARSGTPCCRCFA